MYQCAIYGYGRTNVPYMGTDVPMCHIWVRTYHESFNLAGLCYTYDLHWFSKYIECSLDFVLNLHSINTKRDIAA